MINTIKTIQDGRILSLNDCLGVNKPDRLYYAATVSVKQANSTGPTATTITNLRFNTDDTVNPGTVNPLVKPSAGTNRSFSKTVYLNADTTPSGTINNVKIYCDGTIGWTGCILYIGASASYTQASGTAGTTGDDSSVATTNIERYSAAASAKSITGTISNPSTGKITDYVVMQVDVSTSAVAGTLSAETLTFQYDET